MVVQHFPHAILKGEWKEWKEVSQQLLDGEKITPEKMELFNWRDGRIEHPIEGEIYLIKKNASPAKYQLYYHSSIPIAYEYGPYARAGNICGIFVKLLKPPWVGRFVTVGSPTYTNNSKHITNKNYQTWISWTDIISAPWKMINWADTNPFKVKS